MKVLIAPLNWGLGHATRCAALVRQYVDAGHEVVLGGDGDSLVWLKHSFPTLRYVELAHLDLTYGKGNSQVWAMLRALPKLVRWSWEDQARFNQLLTIEPFDRVVSDNRFGLHSKAVHCVYITHQLWIRLPRFWRWLEPLVARWHARIYNQYDEVWVPDYATHAAPCAMPNGLSGLLGHPNHVSNRVRYIGPLSRFDKVKKTCTADYQEVAVLSGLEPQRTILEHRILQDWATRQSKSLLVRGKVKEPFTQVTHGPITIVPWLNDGELAAALCGAEKIICRSGYSTIMDLDQLGVLSKAEWIPTPGQPEQEYLADLHRKQS